MLSRNMWMSIGLGAMLAFMVDPNRGRRRRALMRDRLVHAGRKTRDALDATTRDVANRTSGVIEAARGRWTTESREDRRLTEQVRAALGRASSYPRAINVDSMDGNVTLRGSIIAHELNDLVAAIWRVRGVKAVSNELESRFSVEDISDLHDLYRRRRWPGAAQALMTAAGLAATGVCIAAYTRR